MNMHQWAQLAGVAIAVVSMLRYDVFGHWWHRWDLVMGGGWQPNGPEYWQCSRCGKRKVTRRGPLTDRDRKWVACEYVGDTNPWELGPPPTPFLTLETARAIREGGGPYMATIEQAATNLRTYAATAGYTLDDLSTDPDVIETKRRALSSLRSMPMLLSAEDINRVQEAMTDAREATKKEADRRKEAMTDQQVNQEFARITEIFRENPYEPIVHDPEVEIMEHRGDNGVIARIVVPQDESWR